VKILITGADVERFGNVYRVIYDHHVVFSDTARETCLSIAVDISKLNELETAINSTMVTNVDSRQVDGRSTS
jgi:hypothetical protein